MLINKLFKKKVEVKSYSPYLSLFQSIKGIFNRSQDQSKFIEYYFKSCPVFVATKLISDACASISLVIKDTKKDNFIYDHPILTLLENPNPFKDGDLFMKEITGFFLLTGNCYINIIGATKPVELDSITPRNINIDANQVDGYPQSYSVISSGRDISYSRNDKKKFYSRNGNQLIHLRDFNPDYSCNLVGASTFAGCELEISQYVLASIHNNALLENQARPSGLLTYRGKDSLDQESIDAVKSTIKGEMSGAGNAGKSMFLNGEFDWIQLSQSIKDMDFPTLKKNVTESIFNAAKIPLPMVSPDNMTLANMDSAKYAFYDNAVLPVFKQVLSFLTKNVLSRYPNSENLILTFDESSIEVLAARKVEETKNLAQTGILSINELRSSLGYESLKSGGDEIYQPMNLIPIGSDAYTSNNRTQPTKEKAIFIKTMQDGGYSKEQIIKSVGDYYGD